MKKHIPKTNIDLSLIAVITVASFFLFSKFDLLEKIVEFSAKYEDYEIDEIFSTLIVLSVCLVWFSCRRWKESIANIKKLQVALATIKHWKVLYLYVCIAKKFVMKKALGVNSKNTLVNILRVETESE